MGIFKEFDTQKDDVKENDSDSLGGGFFTPLESGIYDTTITSAYVSKSQGGAMAINLEATTEVDGAKKVITQTFWITSGKAKGCKNYYENKQGEKHYLPGFLHVNHICLLAAGKELASMDTETKLVDVYDPAVRAKVPTKVDMIVDLLDRPITLGIIKQKDNKRKKNPDSGVYEPVNEYRIENIVDKPFRTRDKFTVAEIKAKAEEATFYQKWDKQYAGTLKDISIVVPNPPKSNSSSQASTSNPFN